MGLFGNDAHGGGDLVIVPPKPDVALATQDELSYAHLYGGDFFGHQQAPASAAASVGSAASLASSAASLAKSSHGSVHGVSSVHDGVRGSASTLSSSASGREAPAAAVAGPPAAASAVAPAPPAEEGGKRDPRRGAFTFQVHAEYDLLLHVQRALDRRRGGGGRGGGRPGSTSGPGPRPDAVALSRAIMASVDEYCLKEQWMYHVGSQKGGAIGRFLRGGAEEFRARVGGGGRQVSAPRRVLAGP